MQTFDIYCHACDKLVGKTEPGQRKQVFRCPECGSRMVFREVDGSEYEIRYRWTDKALRLLERRGA